MSVKIPNTGKQAEDISVTVCCDLKKAILEIKPFTASDVFWGFFVVFFLNIMEC